jgi:hypothetical protein
MKLKNLSPNTIGLLQAIGIILYCALIASFFNFLEKTQAKPPAMLGFIVILFLLVVSATITGLMVFGYPVVLALDKKITRALQVIAYTLLYSVLIIILVLFIIFL